MGVVYRVAKGEIYYGVKNVGAFRENKNGKKKLEIDEGSLEDVVCVTSYGEKALKNIEAFIKLLKIKRIVRGAATGLRILKLVDGEADFYILPPSQVKPWDLCAPHAILEASGGNAKYVDGSKISYPNIDNSKTILFTRTDEQSSLIADKIKHTSIYN